MKPSELLVAKVSDDGKSIRILPRDPVTHLYLVGYSAYAVSSARPGEKGGSFYFTLKDFEAAGTQLVVFRAEYTRGGSRVYPSVDFYLALRWEVRKLCVDLECEFTPVNNALPQVVPSLKDDYGIRVLINDAYYSSVQDPEHPDESYVPDVNLLVSYLIGDADEETIIAAAEAHVAEVAAFEQLEKLKIQNEALRRILERGEGNMPALCFVRGNEAYFTTRELSRQTGDNWHLAPHDENAGPPHIPPKTSLGRTAGGALHWDVVRVTWEGPFKVVTHFEDKSLSVNDINAVKAPWLEWNDVKPIGDRGPFDIDAGIRLDRFIRIINEFGGTVTVEEVL